MSERKTELSILLCFMIASELKNARIFHSRPFTMIDGCTYSIYLSHLLVMNSWNELQSALNPSLTVLKK